MAIYNASRSNTKYIYLSYHLRLVIIKVGLLLIIAIPIDEMVIRSLQQLSDYSLMGVKNNANAVN